MRLIDADALKNAMNLNGGCVMCFRYVDNAPTIEAEPVRRGRWEVVDETEPRRYGCSECKRLSWWETNYCSYCGARMEAADD